MHTHGMLCHCVYVSGRVKAVCPRCEGLVPGHCFDACRGLSFGPVASVRGLAKAAPRLFLPDSDVAFSAPARLPFFGPFGARGLAPGPRLGLSLVLRLQCVALPKLCQGFSYRIRFPCCEGLAPGLVLVLAEACALRWWPRPAALPKPCQRTAPHRAHDLNDMGPHVLQRQTDRFLA